MNAVATTTIQVKDAIGPVLNWLVSKAEGYQAVYTNGSISPVFKPREAVVSLDTLQYSTNPAQAYAIIEREGITTIRADDDRGRDDRGFCNGVRIPVWCATIGHQSTTTHTEHEHHKAMFQIFEAEVVYGPTALIAAMRCFCVSELGETAEIPKELLC